MRIVTMNQSLVNGQILNWVAIKYFTEMDFIIDISYNNTI